jgi:hypothetical protein
MLIYDTTGLTFNKAIINSAEVKLFLYIHEAGSLVLMATLDQPPGKVFFTTDEIYLTLFYTDKISLQFLFEATASNMVTVAEADVYKLYMRSDADIRLCEGGKLFSQFEKTANDTAWQTGMQSLK